MARAPTGPLRAGGPERPRVRVLRSWQWEMCWPTRRSPWSNEGRLGGCSNEDVGRVVFFQSGLRFLCALQSGGKMKTEDNMRRMLEDFCPDGWLWMKMGGLVRLVRGTTLFGAPISSLSSKNSMCLRAPVVCLTPHIHPLSLRDSAELDSFMLTWTTCSQYPTDATRRCVWLRLARSVE